MIVTDRLEWIPIIDLSSSLGSRARESIEAIAGDVLSDTTRTSDWSSLSYEIPLFFGYLEKALMGPTWGDITERLNEGIAKAPDSASFALFGGLSGLGWTIEHLSRLSGSSESHPGGNRRILGSGDDDPLEDLDYHLLRQLQRPTWPTSYDLITGLVGHGVYFLEKIYDPKARTGLLLILDQLEKRAELTAHGITWKTEPEHLPSHQLEMAPNGYYNLGVAHGVPGIIYFLNELVVAQIEVGRVECLLDQAMRWFMSIVNPKREYGICDPWIALGKPGCRLAWCYCDLGVAVVLLQVALRSQRTDWLQVAEQLIESVLVWPHEYTEIDDAPLCHGAFGAAHCFNRLYQYTKDSRCLEKALYFIEAGLEMREQNGGVGGFYSVRKTRKTSAAFLNGSIGVALQLLAALSPESPGWDRLLLLSGGTLERSASNISSELESVR